QSALGKAARGFHELRLVHEQERLQRSVGPLAPHLARLARRGVERGHLRWWRCPLPEGVNASAVDLLSAFIGLEVCCVAVGIGDSLPEPEWLRRLHTFPPYPFDQQAARE